MHALENWGKQLSVENNDFATHSITVDTFQLVASGTFQLPEMIPVLFLLAPDGVGFRALATGEVWPRPKINLPEDPVGNEVHSFFTLRFGPAEYPAHKNFSASKTRGECLAPRQQHTV